MLEREALLAAIAAAPDDDLPRLVLADWLEERDDPLGEFIRLQIELEPLRVPRADPSAELERVKQLECIPPGHAERDRTTTLARKLIREADLLQAHQADWLGPIASLEKDNSPYFCAEFRRGFVASVQIGISALGEHGEAVRQACPGLQRLIVLGTLGRCGPLAAQPALAGLPALTLVGGLTPADAVALARSSYLEGLRCLTVWMGGEGDEEACRALAALPALRELVLVQRYGGLWEDDADGLDRQADALASMVNETRGEEIARIDRPFARLFPLDGAHIGYEYYAGHLPGKRPVLVVQDNLGKRPVLIHFDADGHLQDEEQLDLSEKLVKPAPYSWQEVDEEELLEVLEREVGFEPGPIFVREFESQLARTDLRDNINSFDPNSGEDYGWLEYWLWSTGQFLLDDGNLWLDRLGRVHST
jgi:uncharacterized protein (TIGR02996 family)